MKLSRIKALEMCAELWAWIAQTNSPHKSGWPKWNDDNICRFACPCCEYVDKHSKKFSGLSCSLGADKSLTNKCPMVGLWPNGCMSASSPYSQWNAALNIGKSGAEFAKTISDFAKQQLSK